MEWGTGSREPGGTGHGKVQGQGQGHMDASLPGLHRGPECVRLVRGERGIITATVTVFLLRP